MSNFWPKSSNFLLAQFAPSWDQWESLNYSKVHKTWVWWAKIYCIILWQGPFDPLPPTVFVPIKIWKKFGIEAWPPPTFWANVPNFTVFFLKASLLALHKHDDDFIFLPAYLIRLVEYQWSTGATISEALVLICEAP